MNYIFLLAASIVILTCFYFIISPFFSGNDAQEAAGTGNDEDALTLDQIYRAVNEVEMDYLMKKINAEDFEKLKDQYQLLAAEMLKESGKKKPAGSKKRTDEAEAEILEELRKLRKQKG